MELSSNETRTHSAFLAALLNPNGSHGMGDSFLNLFLNEINFNDLDTKTSFIEIEKNAGFISKEYENGGRIDILIQDCKGRAIIIENKIYAGDQYKQLYRYYQYGKNNYTDFKLIYLNLYGNNPSDGSTKGYETTLELGKDFHVISYRDTITKWLSNCINKNEIIEKPTVKETIEQYIKLIKNLTGQSKQKNMEKNIAEIISSNSENIEAAFIIARSSLIGVKENLIKQLAKQLEDRAKSKDIYFKSYPNWGLENEETSVDFLIPNSKKSIKIKFLFDYIFCDLSIGLDAEDCQKENPIEFAKLRTEICKILSYIGEEKKFTNWLFLHYYSNNNSETPYGGLSNWNNRTKIWTDIPNGKTADFLFNIILDIIDKLKGIDL